MILGLALAASLQAHLFVLQQSSAGNNSGPGMWTFNETTGAPIATFAYENEGYYSMTVTTRGEVYATTNILGLYSIQRFTPDGQYLGNIADFNAAGLSGVSRGPDGNLYCIFYDEATQRSRIVCLDRPATRTFVANGTGGMNNPLWMIFGPDGHLYVADRDAGILKFNGGTGAAMGTLVPFGRGGLTSMARMVFGPDGRMYVSTGAGNSVLRFDGSTGAFVDTFVAPGSGGLNSAWGLAFGPDGHLCVVSRDSNQVLRFNGSTGAYLNVAAADSRLRSPLDIGFAAAATRTDSVWFDDDVPTGAVTSSGWQWSTQSPYSGARSHLSPTSGGLQEHSFNFASSPLAVAAGDSLFVYVNLGSRNSNSSEIMVSWCDGAGWEHRAYWGTDAISYGQNGSAGRRYMGALPPSGWARLEVPADLLGLEGKSIQGMSFSAYNVTAAWDRAGKMTTSAAPPSAPDTIAPTVAITDPVAGTRVSGDLSIRATGNDNVGVTRVGFFVDGDEKATMVDNPVSPYFMRLATRTWSNGTHTLVVKARDAAGNWGVSDPRSFVVDNGDVTYPTIAITSPTNNSTLSGDVQIQATASDNVGVAKVEFEINGTLIGVDNTPPYAVTWNSRTIADGSYTLVARATDTSGNINAVTAAVTISNGAPPPPPPPPPPSGGTEIVWVEDALPAGAWGGGNGGDGWNWVTGAYSGSLAHQSSNSPGVHDHGFNEASQPFAIQAGDQLLVYVYLDPANTPQAVMLSWMDGTSWDHRAYWGADVIPYGTPNTPGKVRAGNLPAAGGWARLTVSAAAVGLEGRSLSGLSFIVSNGRVTWDRAGKISAGTTTQPPPPSGDTTAPAVSVLEPAGGTTVAGSVWLRARATDNQTVTSLQIRVDGATVASTAATGPSVDYGQAWSSTSVANGSHVITAVAVDSSGNQGTSASVTINVNNTNAPAVTMWMEGAIPVGASPGAVGGDAWTWIDNASPASPSGARVHQSANVAGYHEHSFNFAWYPLALSTGDSIFVYVLIDPANPPKEMILSWCDGSSWEHRAYWGENRVDFGSNNTASRRYMGPVPTTSGWVQLQIPASQVGLEGRGISGMAFGLVDGRVTWDSVGKVGP